VQNQEQKIIKRDDRMLKNEKSWRRARIGAIFLFLIFSMMITFIYKDDFLSRSEKIETLAAVGVWFILWLAIIETLNFRIMHIDSIKLYRKKACIKNNSKEEKQP
jgi:hypothetical protein